ncbi:hypothetical protein C9374_013464 [Naegleria lovaniensis]|uniref:[acyl-carrier-protein] S-malonyltransferase n=1 Tax=Naegleria lovaniensis TaxID=51637 RepID=A0AA88GWS2_NAELO|nr:uncharacterized protein C9374_013464 [Naegleria lovaniensis]KAG2391979.1 hypothetical protein C9374_013464 [Naegleria lovaniensis]
MFQDFHEIHPVMKSDACKKIFFHPNSMENLDDSTILNAFKEFNFPVFQHLDIKNVENPPTSLAQPLILMQSYMLFERYNKMKNEKNLHQEEQTLCMLGHSLGEFTAMTAAQGLTIEEATRLVHERGLSMERNITKEQEKEMAMKAIINVPEQLMKDIENYLQYGATGSEALALCCDMANINTPQQVVLSGRVADIDKQIQVWQENYKCKLRTVPLNVHLPFHSKYLKPVANDLKLAYEQINLKNRELACPIVCNLNAKFVQNLGEMVLSSIDQVYSPVLWNMSIQNIVKHVTTNHKGTTKLKFIEFGPQKKLEPMISKCYASMASVGNVAIEGVAITSVNDIEKYLF